MTAPVAGPLTCGNTREPHPGTPPNAKRTHTDQQPGVLVVALQGFDTPWDPRTCLGKSESTSGVLLERAGRCPTPRGTAISTGWGSAPRTAGLSLSPTFRRYVCGFASRRGPRGRPRSWYPPVQPFAGWTCDACGRPWAVLIGCLPGVMPTAAVWGSEPYFAEEGWVPLERCPVCGARVGRHHHLGCSKAYCLECDEQQLGCGCPLGAGFEHLGELDDEDDEA